MVKHFYNPIFSVVLTIITVIAATYLKTGKSPLKIGIPGIIALAQGKTIDTAANAQKNGQPVLNAKTSAGNPGLRTISIVAAVQAAKNKSTNCKKDAAEVTLVGSSEGLSTLSNNSTGYLCGIIPGPSAKYNTIFVLPPGTAVTTYLLGNVTLLQKL